MIRPSNQDDQIAADDYLRFTLSRPARVLLAFSAGARPPAWAAGFAATGAEFELGGAGRFALYARDLPAGPVVLGGNRRSTTGAVSTYLVFAVARSP